MALGRNGGQKNSWKTCKDTYIERNTLTENEDKRRTENLKHRPWERRKRLGKTTFQEQWRTKIRTEAYTCVLACTSNRRASTAPAKYWIVSSKTGNNTKECKLLELHQCGTRVITVQITRMQKL